MKQIEVQIMSQSYLLGCPEGGEAQMMAAVGKVDAAMCKIRDAAKIKARERIAVLAALNLAFEVTEESATTTPVTAAQLDLDGAPSQQLTDLIAKLDEALGDDGRLL
ncbi:MAG: cell division protein ZapA [Burkholderiaceae bacterium]|jgi:cell division protein ZapA